MDAVLTWQSNCAEVQRPLVSCLPRKFPAFHWQISTHHFITLILTPGKLNGYTANTLGCGPAPTPDTISNCTSTTPSNCSQYTVQLIYKRKITLRELHRSQQQINSVLPPWLCTQFLSRSTTLINAVHLYPRVPNRCRSDTNASDAQHLLKPQAVTSS